MSGVQFPKWKSYVLPSVEQVHILRAPPSSIHTRKKERVDMSDVEYMIRQDDSRINEGVSYLARGINPHTDVMYTNTNGLGGMTTNSLPNLQASNPYKAIKDGAFRPPEYFQEDLLPLSRLQHPESAVSTNPGIRGGFVIPNLVDEIDKGPIKSAIDVSTNTNYIPMHSKASYRIQMPINVFAQYGVKEDLRQIPMNTNVQVNMDKGDMFKREVQLKDSLKIGDVHSNFSIYVYNPQTQDYTTIEGSVKDKQNIAVQTTNYQPISLERSDGTQIKLQNYEYKVVNTNAGGQGLAIIVRDTDDMTLTRNLPLHAINSGYIGFNKYNFTDMQPITANKVKASVDTPLQIAVGVEDATRNYNYAIDLRRQGTYGSFDNAGSYSKERYDYVPTLRKDMDRQRLATRQYGDRYDQSS